MRFAVTRARDFLTKSVRSDEFTLSACGVNRFGLKALGVEVCVTAGSVGLLPGTGRCLSAGSHARASWGSIIVGIILNETWQICSNGVSLILLMLLCT
jgi:hypothetical protein